MNEKEIAAVEDTLWRDFATNVLLMAFIDESQYTNAALAVLVHFKIDKDIARRAIVHALAKVPASHDQDYTAVYERVTSYLSDFIWVQTGEYPTL